MGMRRQTAFADRHNSEQNALYLFMKNRCLKTQMRPRANAKPQKRSPSVLSKPDPGNNATERIAADSHPMMALIATKAQKTAAAITGKKCGMRTHDRDIARSRRLDAIAHVKRIDRAQRRVSEMPRLPRDHIHEGLAPWPVKAGWIAIADKMRCHGKHPRISFIDSRAPDSRIAASRRVLRMPMPPLMAIRMISVMMPVMGMRVTLIMMMRMITMIIAMVVTPMSHRVGFGMS